MISQPGMRLLGLEPLVVIGTALPVIIPGAASGAVRYRREGLIRWAAVAATVPAGLVAAVGGSVAGRGRARRRPPAAARSPPALLGLSSYRMGRGRRRPVPPEEPLAETDAPEAPAPAAGRARRPPRGARAIGVVAGLLSGLLGIGGGVIMVPAFVQLARMEVKSAIATSLVCVGRLRRPRHDHPRTARPHRLAGGGRAHRRRHPRRPHRCRLAIRATDRRLRSTVAAFLGLTAVLYAAGELRALLG